MKIKLLLLFIIIVNIIAGCSQGQQTPVQDIIEQTDNDEIGSGNVINELDKSLFNGKWKSEEFEVNGSTQIIFLKIENVETELQISFNYNTTASYYSSYAEKNDNSLFFYYNDEEHRAENVLRLISDDLIKCKFSIKNCFGMSGMFEKEIEFTRISDEEEEAYNKINYIVEPKDLSRFSILREYAEYGKERFDVEFEFKFDERENMLDIIDEYNLDELVEGKSDVETAIILMNWLCERYKHGNPPGGLASVRTPQALMEFADQNNGTTNCRGLSLMLAQLIRGYNIKAFHITCMPYEDPFDDCHVVVSVYYESLNKWIMLDPTYNLYLKNESDEIIGIEEFRDFLIKGGKLFANDEAGYGGNKFNLRNYREYMAKNLIRLERGIIECYGSDEYDGSVILIPEKYMQNEAKNFNENYQKSFMTSNEDFWKE